MITAGWLLILLVCAACCAVVIAAAVLGAQETKKFRCWEERERPMDDYGNCVDQVAELRQQLAAALLGESEALLVLDGTEAQLATTNIRLAALLASVAAPCQWVNGAEGGQSAACGFSWIGFDPDEEGFTHCPGCGRPLAWDKTPAPLEILTQ